MIRRLNLPNQLTLARLVLSGLFVLTMSIDWSYSATTALVVFLVASITDWLDGEIARKQNLITDFGKLFDPLADKILVSAALISLIGRGLAPMWIVVAIIAREFLITGLRILAANKQQIMAAEKLGKHKTVTQMLAILVSLAVLSLSEFGLQGTVLWIAMSNSLPYLYGFALVVTVISGAVYFSKNRFLIDQFVPPQSP